MCPLPVKSPATIAIGSAAEMGTAAPKLPFPAFRKTSIVPAPGQATAMSGYPSPFRSVASTAAGAEQVEYVTGAWKVPVPAPRYTVMLLFELSVATNPG